MPKAAVMTTAGREYPCRIMTSNSHSEPTGRIVAARKLRTKSSERLGVVKVANEKRESMRKKNIGTPIIRKLDGNLYSTP